MTKLQPKRNIWAVRDEDGLVHIAAVTRFFDDEEDKTTMMHVTTACHPPTTQVRPAKDVPCIGHYLPKVPIFDTVSETDNAFETTVSKAKFVLKDWNVREAPTCLGCAARSDWLL